MKELITWLTALITSWFNPGPTVVPTPLPSHTPSVSYQIVEVARNLEVPWSIVFTESSRMLVTERPGRIREIKEDTLTANPLITFAETRKGGEDGLMGMDIDPNYSENKYVYVCLTYIKDSAITDKVVRLIDNGDTLSVDKIILDDIPAANFHAGCRIKFGPDNKLYVTTGDAREGKLAQDKKSKAGKILRMNADGSDFEIYSLGHRNPQGIAWSPSGQLWETEHGPSGFDGPEGGDEINIITENGNYGWPLVSHLNAKSGYISPKIVFTPAVAPSGADFLGNNFYFAALKGAAIYKVSADFKYEMLQDINYGRIREITAGPDGALYFSTSNRDGRGSPQPGDDKIYKILGLK